MTKKENGIIPGPALVHISTLPLLLTKKGKKEAVSASTAVPQLRATPKKKVESNKSFKEVNNQAFKNHSFQTVLIQEGLGNMSDCFFYTKEALKAAADSKLFEGIQCFADHPSEIEEQILPERSTRDILGYYQNVIYQEDATGRGSLVSDLCISSADSLGWALSLLTNSIDYSTKFKESDLVGLSINASGSSDSVGIDEFMSKPGLSQSVLDKLIEAKNNGVTEINVVTALTAAKSVDLVTQAGAGGKILKMLEMEKKMAKKIKESEGKEAGAMPPGQAPSPGTPNHADAGQDQALFAKMIKQYLGKDQADPEEMEAAKHAYEAHKETGMDETAAYEAAGNHLKMAMAIGNKMAQGKPAAPVESEESEESKKEAEEKAAKEAEEKEKKEAEGKKDPMENKKESMVIELSGEVAKLRESIKKYELRDHMDKKLKESGKSNAFTKKFREALGTPKSVAHIDDMWKLFVKAADAGVEEVGTESDSFMLEKNNYRESGDKTGKSDFSDCLR